MGQVVYTKYFIMKKFLLSIAVLAVSISACKKNNNAPANTAGVMFAHGCAAGAATVNLDALDNGKAVSGATNMAFLRNSGYQNLTAGAGMNLAFNATGLSALTSGSVTLVANNHYTAFAGGSITAPVFVFTSDDLTAPTTGNAKVRFINLCPDGLNTSCYIGTTKLDSNVGYKSCTQYFEVAPSTGKVAMIDQVVLANSAVLNGQSIAAGKIYTFMLTGTVAGSGTSVLTLTPINNN